MDKLWAEGNGMAWSTVCRVQFAWNKMCQCGVIKMKLEVPPSPKMATAEDELLLPRLPELFETSKQLLDEVEVATEPTGSRVIQEKVIKGLDLLKKAAEMLSQLDLFSRNEDLEEIASTDLKYLMVPAFQGALTMKQVNPSKRLDHLQWAREHFLNYLIQCRYYHVAEFELPKTKNNSTDYNTASSSMAYPNLADMASQRQAKIERYKQKKELEHRLSALKSAVESGQADDEHVREYYLLHLRRWIGISLEEIESIDQEMKILREKDSSTEASTSHSPRQDRPPMKPFVLTRNVAQAKVFGAGYPSLASMTVNDWYDQHRKFGALPDQGIAKTPAELKRSVQQQEDEEQKEEVEDDEQTHRRAREWDDWKDTHPRGYGNRQNMG
ncbi:immunoglobulin-binding protein 1-like [Zalophus californianus]|uniref:immunoglobulin-binding protein 1-like n=1 Tax=Zalophus californianus TaxID=9704 RepID=UPI0015F18337|nr:immunoglobulin-binding protein 1-like [Zalophus californianus]XP_035585039.1 immunoglobulin-binding protein 1-like [Zalophus californianus]XP_035585040.1 immunoglobulin-binding protein 1-like [Zalophus californianus]